MKEGSCPLSKFWKLILDSYIYSEKVGILDCLCAFDIKKYYLFT